MSTTSTPEDLRGVAVGAARRFLDEPGSLTLLGHGQSLTYRVDAAGGAYLLRVHSPLQPNLDPTYLESQVIESECAWLRAIADDTSLVVQKPVASPDGGYVLSMPRPGSADPVPCTLLTWVEGELIEGKRTEEQAIRLGGLLAELQRHAESWARPPGFERPIHDQGLWQRVLPRVDHLVSIGVVSAGDRTLLSRTVDQLDRELMPWVRKPGCVGLIHGDLHESNYVYHNGSPRPIDFGRCGLGPWLYDLAECIGHLHPHRRRDLLDAYAKRRPFGDGDMRLLEGYFIAAVIDWIGTHALDSTEHEVISKFVPGYGRFMRDYLDHKAFMFER